MAKLPVFISWSGERSRCLARRLNEWLPSIIPDAQPFYSPEIAAGGFWSQKIAHHLENASFGILCITAENLRAPWLNFEAGGLWKGVSGMHVCPLLLDVSVEDLTGPVSLFQAKSFERQGMQEIIRLLAELTNMDQRRAEISFEAIWPRLSRDVTNDLRRLTKNASSTEKTSYIVGGGRLVHGPARDAEGEEKDTPATRRAYRQNAYLACFVIRELYERNPFPELRLRDDWWVYATTRSITLTAKNAKGREVRATVEVPNDWGKGETGYLASKLSDELVKELK
jgi:hypothetical protein